MQVCIVYDCLYPSTIGGAERWYRNVAEALVADGHDVTYLTLRQWDRGDLPDLPGVRVVAVGPRMALYADGGRRRLLPPLFFGLGVLSHLLRHGRRYDVVHTASFPYFSCSPPPRCGGAAATGSSSTGTRSGRASTGASTSAGWAARSDGASSARACASRSGRSASRGCTRAASASAGLRGELTRLEGQYDGSLEPAAPLPARAVAVFAGRHIPEKQVPVARSGACAGSRAGVPISAARSTAMGRNGTRSCMRYADCGLDGVVTAPGFVNGDVLEDALSTALCLVLPSRREGYGRVVIEASARGVPVVVVAGPTTRRPSSSRRASTG